METRYVLAIALTAALALISVFESNHNARAASKAAFTASSTTLSSEQCSTISGTAVVGTSPASSSLNSATYYQNQCYTVWSDGTRCVSAQPIETTSTMPTTPVALQCAFSGVVGVP
jgi:hypothetical protein